MDAETRALLQLTQVQGLGPRRIHRLVDHFGNAAAALSSATVTEWARALKYNLGRAEQAKAQASAAETRAWVDAESDKARRANVLLVGLNTPGYPALLAQAIDAPPVLWIKGELLECDQASLAIVGARKCTGYGREQAERFGYHAADAGLTVVSGGAYGIDAAAHHGALSSGGRTVAVLGSAVDMPYPKEHAALFDQIADGRGAVISELPLGTGPHHTHFLPRNRIIACLTLGTLVIEAAARSGSLNTARRAVEEGRPAMYLPGRVDSDVSTGCHKMIRAGEGELVHGIADVLETLGESTTLLQAAVEQATEMPAVSTKPEVPARPVALNEQEQTLWESLASRKTLDEVIQASGLPAHVVNASLTMLELRGVVAREGGYLRRV